MTIRGYFHDLCCRMPNAAAKHIGPTMNAVTASILIMKESRVAYLESAFVYSFPATVTEQMLV
jgi:hypothetical protein